MVVAVTGAGTGDGLIRRAATMAERAGGALYGVHVRAPGDPVAEPADLEAHKRLLTSLGGTYHELEGADPAAVLVRFARANGAGQLVVGSSGRSRWGELLRGSVVNRLVRTSGPIDVHVIGGEPGARARIPLAALSTRRQVVGLALAVVGVPLITVVLAQFRDEIDLQADMLIFLMLVVVVATIGGTLPALVAAVGGALAVNWYFTEPLHTLTISEGENVFSLAVFATVGIVISLLVSQAAQRRSDAQRARTHAAALAEADALRTALLRGVSHDLRTPLASIKASATSLLQDDVDWSPAQAHEFLTTIDEETDRLDRVVGNLLDMSRLEAGPVELVLRPVGVDEVVAATLAAVNAPTDRVEVDVPETLPPLRADAALLERALANLVANALAVSPAGAPVIVRADTADDQMIRIQVADRGPGVAADQRDRMFEPFERLGDEPDGTGVGLGLAVARGFVTAMGGRLAVEDTPGGGLTMTASIPVAV